MMRRVVGAVAVGLVALGLSACDAARGPMAVDAISLSAPVSPDKTRLIIYTEHDRGALLTQSEVFVNRRRVGRVRHNGVLMIDLDPGIQVVSVNSELALDTTFPTTPGQVFFIRLEDGKGGWPVGRIIPVPVEPAVAEAELVGMRMTDWRY